MKRLHLDTSFLIRSLVRASSEDLRLREWLDADVAIGISAIAWAEFLCGPYRDPDRRAVRLLVSRPAALDEDSAELAATMFNGTGRRRGTFTDCLIAAAAVTNDAQLATSNPRDFLPMKAFGLELT
jgi:predicted nucleic acid-binding protein